MSSQDARAYLYLILAWLKAGETPFLTALQRSVFESVNIEWRPSLPQSWTQTENNCQMHHESASLRHWNWNCNILTHPNSLYQTLESATSNRFTLFLTSISRTCEHDSLPRQERPLSFGTWKSKLDPFCLNLIVRICWPCPMSGISSSTLVTLWYLLWSPAGH